MRVEIPYIDDCPNWVDGEHRVRTALDRVGLPEVPVEARVVRTTDDATRLSFAGSPTILVDGRDAFPTASRAAALACRVFRTESGLAGLPSVEQLIHVVSSAARNGETGARQ